MNQEPDGSSDDGEAHDPTHSNVEPIPATESEANPASEVSTSDKQQTSGNKKRKLSEVPKLAWSLIDHPKLVAFGGLVIVSCSVLGLVIAIIQYRLTVRSGIESGQQTDRLIVNSNEIAKALHDSVAQSNKALEASLAESREDRRAWLHFELVEIVEPIRAGERFAVNVAVKNTGKTPAIFQMGGKVFVTIFPTEIIHEVTEPDMGGYGSEGVLAPNQIMTGTFKIDGTLDPQQFKGILDGTISIIFCGKISYRDIFDQRHETVCSGYLTGADHGRFKASMTGNDLK